MMSLLALKVLEGLLPARQVKQIRRVGGARYKAKWLAERRQALCRRSARRSAHAPQHGKRAAKPAAPIVGRCFRR